MSIKLSDAGANAEANAFAALFNSGYLRIYNGTRPADANTAITTQTKLAELRFGSTAFGSASAGVITANAITSDSDAAATGTASWFRCFKSDGTTVLMDGDVGSSGADLNLNTTAIQQHAQVSVTSFQHTVTE